MESERFKLGFKWTAGVVNKGQVVLRLLNEVQGWSKGARGGSSSGSMKVMESQ